MLAALPNALRSSIGGVKKTPWAMRQAVARPAILAARYRALQALGPGRVLEFLHGRVSPAGEGVWFFSFRADLFPGGSDSSVTVRLCFLNVAPRLGHGGIAVQYPLKRNRPRYRDIPDSLRRCEKGGEKVGGYCRRSWKAARGLVF